MIETYPFLFVLSTDDIDMYSRESDGGLRG